MKQEEDKFTGLPENAFRELKPGEVYNPLMSPKKTYPEVNLWSVAWGIAMAILFSPAAYLGLKVGQVFEAAIPIAIIAVGSIRRSQTQNALGETSLSNPSAPAQASSWQEPSSHCLPSISCKPNIRICRSPLCKCSSVHCWAVYWASCS